MAWILPCDEGPGSYHVMEKAKIVMYDEKGFLPGHSVTTTGWIPKLPKFFHEINIYILKKRRKKETFWFLPSDKTRPGSYHVMTKGLDPNIWWEKGWLLPCDKTGPGLYDVSNRKHGMSPTILWELQSCDERICDSLLMLIAARLCLTWTLETLYTEIFR